MTTANLAMLIISLVAAGFGIYFLFCVWTIARLSLGFTGRIQMNDGGWVMIILTVLAGLLFFASYIFWPLQFTVTVGG